MHDCLKIAELVDMICSKLDCSYRQDQRALAAVARTCETFKDPALDHLWRSASLGKLLTYCMPSDLWTVDIEDSPDELWFTTRTVASHDSTQLRPICDSDWQRVRLYAPRIRKLTSGQDVWDLEGIFPSLSVAFPASVLQNLRDLNWYHYNDDFSYIQIFLRPSLTGIAFDLTATSDCSLLLSLVERCPQLANIAIAADPGVDLEPLSRFVARLPLAETISVPWLEQDALEHLSKLPTLKSLTMGRLPEAPAVSSARMAPAFAALRHMSLNDGTLGDMTQFLRLCRDVPLETLSVELNHCPPAADIHSLLTAVTASVSHSTLTRLLLDSDGDSLETPDPVIYLIHPDTLVLLLCFENLTSLHLTSALGFDLEDDTVSRMARAWPLMESLYLAPIRVSSAPRPRTTLASLYGIARHCPRIIHLTIAFDGSDVPSPSAASPRNQSLKQLDVLHSPITTAIAMERFLFGVFPNLDRITASRAFINNEDEAAIRYHRCWTDVSGLRAERNLPRSTQMGDKKHQSKDLRPVELAPRVGDNVGSLTPSNCYRKVRPLRSTLPVPPTQQQFNPAIRSAQSRRTNGIILRSAVLSDWCCWEKMGQESYIHNIFILGFAFIRIHWVTSREVQIFPREFRLYFSQRLEPKCPSSISYE
ncbi:hypothetical protein DFH06DRAFT_1130909 [Mycena polygramma]|nr:hypothetical protein DFH06DRAFT_1130909 [Mycena polygramma]